MGSKTRRASHAGSWYKSSSSQLNQDLSNWLSKVQPIPGTDILPEIPLKGSKAVIAPHAGYSYSGPAAAWAYASIDTTDINRVFLLGPSHHVYLNTCALSKCDEYETPLGNLPLDSATISQLKATGKFDEMSISTDEDEHSIEMHLPYVRKIFQDKDIRVVPILVGAISTEQERSFGQALAPYLSDPHTFFVISSDFCHWGTRFRYTYYQPASGPSSATSLKQSTKSSFYQDPPIHSSIESVDRRGMSCCSFPSNTITIQPIYPQTHKEGEEVELETTKTASRSHNLFANYLSKTNNTICGRHPIGVLLGAIASLQASGSHGWKDSRLDWVRYEQSSACEDLDDSSVSYASAVVRIPTS